MCVGKCGKEAVDQTTVRQGRGTENISELKTIFAFILFYYLHNYLKYMSIILFTIHRVTCNDIFRGVNPLIGGGPVPSFPPGFTPMGVSSTKDFHSRIEIFESCRYSTASRIIC